MVSVNLILATGSRAGTEAPLMCGYYMIGRDKSCQIRPKSRSVSRRHCLVHHMGHSVRVFDLDSTSGTRINGDRIAAKVWVDLENGDLLKVGRIGFGLKLHEFQDSKTSTSDPPVNAAVSEDRKPSSAAVPQIDSSAETVVTGAAWETFDVAAFLESADQKDQERRYQKIRTMNALSDLDTIHAFDGGDIDEARPEACQPATSQLAKAKPNPPPRKMGKAKATRSWSIRLPNPSHWFVGFGGSGGAKMALAAVISIAVLGYAGWRIYQFSAGPEVRILREIE